MTDSAFDAWKLRAATTPIATAAEQLGLTLRRVTGGRGGAIEMAGPCPACGGNDRFSINTRKGVYNCRHCGGGRGAIDLVIFARKVSFLQACELITGEPPPDRESKLTADDQVRFEAQARELAEKEAKRQADENAFRERERRDLYGFYERARDLAGSPAEAYIALRGLKVPSGLRAKCILDMPYYRGGGEHGEILAHAPVLVLPIVDAGGIFRGLHFTYIDLAKPNGKLVVVDPETGEHLDAKKVRGSKKGNKVEIIRRDNPRQLVMGEGFEKTTAVWMALAAAGHDITRTAFWSACDLGNLAGKCAKSVRHPTARNDKTNRPVMVKGPDPDPEDPGIVIPDSVEDLVLLGDSTSEPIETQCAMYRAFQRYKRDGRTVRVFWAPEGKDFDDVVREAA